MGDAWKTYLVGPFYVLLPKRWRQRDPNSSERHLAGAAVISGIGEAVATLFVLSAWFMKYFAMLGGKYATFATSPDGGTSVSPLALGEMGLLVFATHPLTLLILYFGMEGVFRAVGALTMGEVAGTLPLYGAEFFWRLATRRDTPELPLVPDEITPGDATCDLRISSCRRRDGWKYPFTLRYGGAYFQVMDEQCMSVGPRPYIYSLRRLPAGEVARGLQNYDPSDVLTPVHRVESLG